MALRTDCQHLRWRIPTPTTGWFHCDAPSMEGALNHFFWLGIVANVNMLQVFMNDEWRWVADVVRMGTS